ncbi:phage tail assembly chaperone [Paenirhodobacter populi]|uniref:Phage tail assembly chaperone-like domain-containing protein n=1 Tax=Paenirhodobacter populi TaxID=2306993 RepID=A0A443J0X0_9RHOB|nr:phage tail assembly chaperone [Sinirhodobacter populi]RWR14261.1 hypothetical protein D2T33_03330 [Sinirhodobacter populi]
MIAASIHDARGAIVTVGRYPDGETLAANVPAGGGYIEGHFDPEAVYVSNGQAVSFPPRPSPLHGWDWHSMTWAENADLTDAVWAALRAERDQRIEAVEWRLRRSDAERELGLTLSEDRVALLVYIQALRDLPELTTDPTAPIWPVPPQEA